MHRLGPIALIAGTRPEVIKLFSIYHALRGKKASVVFIAIGQHSALLNDALNCLGIQPDQQVEIMRENQDLFHVTSRVLFSAKKILKKINPSMVVVQGDTTTAMSSALAAFYCQIPVAHVEAGLRTGQMFSPYPEEMNRKILSELSSLHFAPSKKAENQLIREGIKRQNIFTTGNTGVDALLTVLQRLQKADAIPSRFLVEKIERERKRGQKIVLMTTHRRESFARGMSLIFVSLRDALEKRKALSVFFPVHPNPKVKAAIEKSQLSFCPNLFLLDSLSYIDLVYLLNSSDFVMTDSGGLQEEAASLEKPVIVLRNESDRLEACEQIIGTDGREILKSIDQALRSRKKMNKKFPYGDGTAGEKIASLIQTYLRGDPCLLY